MRVGFATDIHLDRELDVQRFPNKEAVGREIASGLDVLIVGGDISIGPSFEQHFGAFVEGAGIPVYFVLGNHDFWDASEADVRATAAKFPGNLDTVGVVELTPNTALVGRTGWYDTLTGNPFKSKIRTQDCDRTERLVNIWRDVYLLQRACRAWSAEEASKAQPVLEEAARKYENVIFVTHFPCFKEACWDEYGRPDREERGWGPWSINTTLGHVLLDTMAAYPNVKFTLLTGHTHGGGRKRLRDNLLCISGRAVSGHPRLAVEFHVD